MNIVHIQTSKIEKRLARQGLALFALPSPLKNLFPYTMRDNQVFVSGQLPLGPEGLRYIGKVGESLSPEDGRRAAELCTLNILAQLKEAGGGGLDLLRRCLRISVSINAAPDFVDLLHVADGASDLLKAVLDEDIRHARTVIGVNALPYGVAVEVDGLFEIF